MINLACKIPKKIVLACSGGKDSMSALDFLLRGRREVTVAYYDHGTQHGKNAFEFVKNICNNHNLPFVYGKCNVTPPPGVSKENFWREHRYEFFKSLREPIITGHHLDDAVEWWIFSSLRGNPRLIPVKRENPKILRPFLWSCKKDLHTQLKRFDYIEDPTNENTNFARNYIRHNLGPLCLNVNPGLAKTVRNLYERH